MSFDFLSNFGLFSPHAKENGEKIHNSAKGGPANVDLYYLLLLLFFFLRKENNLT